ncbi:hypothetical protein J2X47_004528 [Sphingomonas sp. BE270]|jgi:hypothetical protein|nr:hypothetical protein [Sphingomonas sp. BE270]
MHFYGNNARDEAVDVERDLAPSVRHCPFAINEQAVLNLADHDTPRSIPREKSLINKLGGWLFGSSEPNALANYRLETLRRTCIVLREQQVLAAEDVDTWRDAGFSEEQLQYLYRRHGLKAPSSWFLGTPLCALRPLRAANETASPSGAGEPEFETGISRMRGQQKSAFA